MNTDPASDVDVPASDVDVWRIDLDADPHRVAELLSHAETDRAERFRAERDRRRYIVAHGVQRAILATYLETEPRLIKFSATADGKPELASGAIQFNLAHSGDVAMLALAFGCRVGVDVEIIRPVRLRERLMTRFFSRAEAESCDGVSESERDRAFLQIWTRKEAVLKAFGVGISEYFGRISVPSDGATVELQARWAVRDLPAEADYVGAVAAEGSELRVRCHHYEGQ